MKRSRDRILTTHTGSLPRPPELVDLVTAKESGKPVDDSALAAKTRDAVRDVVQEQVKAGIDVVSDGEYGKPGFFQYVHNRLNGFEVSNEQSGLMQDPEFPTYAEWRGAHGFMI